MQARCRQLEALETSSFLTRRPVFSSRGLGIRHTRMRKSRAACSRGDSLVEPTVHDSLSVIKRHRKRHRLTRLERAGRLAERHLSETVEREPEEQVREVKLFVLVGVVADDADELANVFLDGRGDDSLEVAGRENLGSRFPLDSTYAARRRGITIARQSPRMPVLFRERNLPRAGRPRLTATGARPLQRFPVRLGPAA